MRYRLHKNSQGFTVVETILAVSVAAIMATVLFSVTFTYYASAIRSQETASMALESQTLLGQMVEDLRLAAGVGATVQLTDTYAPGGGWATSDPNNVLIVRSPVVNSSRDIMYDSETALPYQNEYIYFLQGSTLYKRILKNTVPAENIAITTCPAANVSASCPEDRIFSKNVSDMTFTFYDFNDAVTTDASQTRSVQVTVHMSKKVYGRTITLSNTMRVTQRNQ